MAKLSDYLAAFKFLPGYTKKPDLGINAASGISYLKLVDDSGVEKFYFPGDTGDLRVSSAEPTATTDGESVGGGTLVASVTLTTAQVLALSATPVSVIAAPGANKAIVIDTIIAYKAAGTAYAGIAAGEDLAFRYTDGSGTILTAIETTGFLDQATAQTRIASLPQSAAGTAKVELTPTANAAVVAQLLTGEIITGTSDVKLKIYYRIVPTVL